MILFPFIAASLVLSEWTSVLQSSGVEGLILILAFGFGWGVGSVAFSLGVSTVGLGVGAATILGIVVAVGGGIPLLRRWEEIPVDARFFAILGMVIALIGVAFVGRAGVIRERRTGFTKTGSAEINVTHSSLPTRSYFVGLVWCVLSGLLSACANLGFDFAEPISQAAIDSGTHVVFSSLFRWIPLFWGGYLAVLIFSGSKLFWRKTWKRFLGSGAVYDFGMAVFLGVAHFGTLVVYGMGAVYLGQLGTSVGYAVATSMGLIVANLLGFLTGEWRKAPNDSVRILLIGLIVLIFAISVLGFSNSLLHEGS
jgi:L-rhamnose-H+ transport protein